MNVVFMSPNFPLNFYNFPRALKENGVTALGIGDQDYFSLNDELKHNLDDYYQVSNLENYEEVYRAFAFLISKWGRIDFVESNNEYWLMQDARLREDFNINTGIKLDNIKYIRYKSMMKSCYEKAGIPTARYHLVNTLENGLEFIKEVGYPVIVKPDDGVGAFLTHKIKNEKELKEFYANKFDKQFIMEEFIDGELVSYDGIADSNRNVIYETGHIFPLQIMNVVNDKLDCHYYSRKKVPVKLQKAGRAVIKNFPSNSRFFHLEFFKLNKAKKGLGKAGDFVGLEVNMRPPGGPTLDMMNYANDIDVYRMWADMLVYDKVFVECETKKYQVAYASRRKNKKYAHSIDEIIAKYKNNILAIEENPEVIAGAMGDYMFIARFTKEKEIMPFINMVIEGEINSEDTIL